MKTNLKSSLLVAAALLAAPFASAQLTLHTFSAFESPTNTVFTGDWELTGDVAGSASPRSSFSQAADFYSFTGGSSSDSASVFHFFDTSIDISGNSLLEISAQLLAGNAAPAFTVTLFDSSGNSASAVFSTAAFTSSGFTTASVAMVFSPSFNQTDLSFFKLSGDDAIGGTDLLNLAVDNLAVNTPRAFTPVPEPSTYGMIGAAALLALAGYRRLRVRG